MKKMLIIVTAVFFGLLVLINAAIFGSVLSGPALIVASAISWIIGAILSIGAASSHARLSKTTFDDGRKIGDYFKGIWSVIILMVLFSAAVSFAGGIITFLIVTFIKNKVDSIFLNGAIFTILMFIIYLAGVYKTFVKIGFEDAQKKIFNLNFKILTLLLLLIFIMPSTVFSNAYSIYYLDNGLFIDLRSVFSFNINLTIIENYAVEALPKINMITVVLKVLITLAIEMLVAIFAYIRGKTLFIRQHLTDNVDYQTDEALHTHKTVTDTWMRNF